MGNQWKQIWEKRSFDYDVLQQNDVRQTFLALKRSDGFDLMDGSLTLDAMIRQHEDIKTMLSKTAGAEGIQSVYEVGCGSGANLLLFEQDGMTCGGVDYSEALTTVAARVLRTDDIICAEAIETPAEPVYDAVFSNSVFGYFADTDYAARVLEIMYAKAKYAIGLIDVHDIEKKDAYTAYRRANIEDYDERYKDLHKLFYSREFFEQFAETHNMDICIQESRVEGYWNNEFVFNCFLYKK